MSGKILVTGATGLLGGNLVRVLAKKGERIRVLTRSTSNTKAIDDLDVERVEGDITDRASLSAAMKGCDRVYHCAALVSMWYGYLEAMRKINVAGAVNVFEEAMAAGVQRVVHVSTVDAIGMRTRANPADEQVSWSYDQYKNAYALTKHEAQEKAFAYARKGLPVVVVNPTYMIGAYDVKPSSGRMILECKAGKTVFATSGGNNFVDVLDVTHAMIAACEHGKPGEPYILANADGNMTYREIFTLIAETVDGTRPRLAMPRSVAMAAGGLLSGLSRLTGKPTELGLPSVFMGYQPHYFTPAKAVRELDMPQSLVRDAIKRAYDWFVTNGYVR